MDSFKVAATCEEEVVFWVTLTDAGLDDGVVVVISEANTLPVPTLKTSMLIMKLLARR
ncbi:hypothetical protein [Paenibacillus sp. Root444D2]|uniref:hypothetical protein n=1 Tax=Paenibacillus sp. Root444D2 TaxID=1736538 RepID=UPI0012E3C55D|nr:hypothetical protein [Paenibacillus sp. Root444D2]